MALSFDQQVKAFAKKANRSVEQTIRGTSIKLFSAVIVGWPVDSGRSRANWQAGGANPVKSTIDAYDKTGGATESKMTATINGMRLANDFTLSNNLPYAHTIEYGGYPGDGPNTVGGFSRQAPQGVVRINAARFERILEEEARKYR